ncbi:MAG TPA: CHASE3 domain-containing protein [Rhodocyclaceae bacterium]|nr:CHASE3 domain-containing protein [Rhodocyclaceae bacterium]
MKRPAVKIFSELGSNPLMLVLAMLAAAALIVISETAYREASGAQGEFIRAVDTRDEVRTLVRSLVDAETNQRGYLLTGEKAYLTPYRDAIPTINRTMSQLDAAYGTNPKGIATMKALHELVSRKLQELASTIRLHDRGMDSTWQAMVMSGAGKQLMENIRALAQEISDAETEHATASQTSVQDTLSLNRIGVWSMVVISLFALGMFLRQTTMLNTLRREQHAAILAERDRLEQQVLLRASQLIELARHLQNAREDERSHLARELHDELGALLTAAKLDAARIKSRLGNMLPEVSDRLAHLNETLNSGIALKRRITENLRPSSLSNLGLIAALDIQAREFTEASSIPVTCLLSPVKLAESAELTVYRLVQEAFTNISKYAQATRVEVHLSERNGHAELQVLDNGIGFDPGEQRTSTHGLLGMRYRVESEGGRLYVDSTLGQGTTICATLPLLTEPAAV